MAEQAQDRHLPATERKIRKARDEGQVARSRDLGHFAAIGAGVGLLGAAAPLIYTQLQRLFVGGLRFDATLVAEPGRMLEHLAALAALGLAVLVPLGSALALVAVAAGVLCGGWNFSWQPLAPRWDKLAPLAGLKRLFALHQFGSMLKASALGLVLFGIGALYLSQHLMEFVGLASMALPQGLGRALDLVQGGLLLLLVPLAVFAAVDAPLQRWMLLRQLRMSVEELKKEHKDVEGNVSVKAKIRARMREVASRRMLAAVPRADLVVMNPTHYAVALKYEEATMAAPRVVAKGADLLALRIRDVARESGVPVLQAPPLARALYAHAELDREIPTALFAAVAQVLAWVFQLRHAGPARDALLAAPPQPQIPDGLDPGLDPAPAA